MMKATKRSGPCRPVRSMPTSPLPPSAPANVPKPMRPLTAYHIFFQIEREYIIQNLAGPDADESIHDGKGRIPDVPRRYRQTRLLPNWYAGPGKRRKRKHRKSHGKIAFLELSQLVSKRWATLDRTDPETKRFVSAIAARELAEYKTEMKHYKKLMKGVTEAQPAPTAPAVVSAATPVALPAKKIRAVVSPAASPRHSPSFGPEGVESSHVPVFQLCQPVECEPMEPLSLDRVISEDSSVEAEEAVDYSICSVSHEGHYIPSASPVTSSVTNISDGQICDPLFELERMDEKRFRSRRPTYERCVSPVRSGMDEDVLNDDYLLGLLA